MIFVAIFRKFIGSVQVPYLREPEPNLLNLNRTYWTWTYCPVQGSANFLDQTQGSGLGSQKSCKNLTDPDRGITTVDQQKI